MVQTNIQAEDNGNASGNTTATIFRDNAKPPADVEATSANNSNSGTAHIVTAQSKEKDRSKELAEFILDISGILIFLNRIMGGANDIEDDIWIERNYYHNWHSKCLTRDQSSILEKTEDPVWNVSNTKNDVLANILRSIESDDVDVDKLEHLCKELPDDKKEIFCKHHDELIEINNKFLKFVMKAFPRSNFYNNNLLRLTAKRIVGIGRMLADSIDDKLTYDVRMAGSTDVMTLKRFVVFQMWQDESQHGKVKVIQEVNDELLNRGMDKEEYKTAVKYINARNSNSEKIKHVEQLLKKHEEMKYVFQERMEELEKINRDWEDFIANQPLIMRFKAQTKNTAPPPDNNIPSRSV